MGEDEEEEGIEIDLENEEDVKIIEEEFNNIYNKDETFRNNFGEQALMLGPLQKYQIIDAYNQNGMEAVLSLLTNSADQSAIMQQMDGNGQADMMGMENPVEDSVIEHNGKKYSRI